MTDRLQIQGVFRIEDIERITGLPRTTLNEWHLPSSLGGGGRGQQRFYSRDDIFIAWTLHGLRLHGIPLAGLREAAQTLAGIDFSDKNGSPQILIFTQSAVMLCTYDKARQLPGRGEIVTTAFNLHAGHDKFMQRFHECFPRGSKRSRAKAAK